MKQNDETFWGHLDEFRRVIFRIGMAISVVAVLAFFGKEWLFDIILAPHKDDFILYQILGQLADHWQMVSLRPDPFHCQLINIELASQFLIHITAALYAGVVIVSPFIIWQLFSFISPALYPQEKHYVRVILLPAFLLFFIGVLLNYFVIFPLSFRFLATYQVNEEVVNMISLTSYVDTLLLLSLMMGIVFEIPVLAYLFAKIGLLKAGYMRKYRRHIVLVILVVAAIITPTTDIFTLLLVSFPMYLLFECSIGIVAHVERKL